MSETGEMSTLSIAHNGKIESLHGVKVNYYMARTRNKLQTASVVMHGANIGGVPSHCAVVATLPGGYACRLEVPMSSIDDLVAKTRSTKWAFAGELIGVASHFAQGYAFGAAGTAEAAL